MLNSEERLVCKPLDSYKELLGFALDPPVWKSMCTDMTPHSEYAIRNSEERKHFNELMLENPLSYCHFEPDGVEQPSRHKASTLPKTLVCHDMANGYHDDSVIEGTSCYDAYTFYNWAGIDIFCYFSHHLITIPPLGWINVGHAHGVKVIGTVITEWDSGIAFWDKVLSSEQEMQQCISALVVVAKTLHFDGWLLNVENKIASPGRLVQFVRGLHRALHAALPAPVLIWYDSVTLDGQLDWQNKLNAKNKDFFDACDGFFTNYSWSTTDVLESVSAAEGRLTDLYVGIDVWGRNFFGGGQFNTQEAVKIVHSLGCSVAIFAPAWSHEAADESGSAIERGSCLSRRQRAALRERALWGSLWPLLHTRLPSALPFASSFCRGQGTKRRRYGEVLCPSPWYNLRHMQYQPNAAHGPHGYVMVVKQQNDPVPHGQSLTIRDSDDKSPDNNSPEHNSLNHNSPEHNSLDNNSPDNESPDNKSPDNESPDNNSPDGKSPENKSPDNNSPDGKSPENKSPDNNSPDDKLPDYKSPENNSPDNKSPDDKTPDKNSPDNKSPDNNSPDDNSPENNLLEVYQPTGTRRDSVELVKVRGAIEPPNPEPSTNSLDERTIPKKKTMVQEKKNCNNLSPCPSQKSTTSIDTENSSGKSIVIQDVGTLLSTSQDHNVRTKVYLAHIPHELECLEVFYEDSFNGGSCLKINPSDVSSSDHRTIRLFYCDFFCKDTLIICFVTKIIAENPHQYLNVLLNGVNGSGNEVHVDLMGRNVPTRGWSSDLVKKEYPCPQTTTEFRDLQRYILLNHPDFYIPTENSFDWKIWYFQVPLPDVQIKSINCRTGELRGGILLGHLGLCHRVNPTYESR